MFDFLEFPFNWHSSWLIVWNLGRWEHHVPWLARQIARGDCELGVM
jgi:hypothetical protein